MHKIASFINGLFSKQQIKSEDFVSTNFIQEVVSGGQTGVDRAALDVAIKFQIRHGGWCPYGRKAEDGIIPAEYKLKEAPAPTQEENMDPYAIYKKRTELNAKDSDGTLIIVKKAPMGGTLYTIAMAEKHKKPYFIFLSDNTKVDESVKWIQKNNIRKLNVAGPRESETLGIYNVTYDVMQQILNHQLLNQNQHTSVTYKRP